MVPLVGRGPSRAETASQPHRPGDHIAHQAPETVRFQLGRRELSMQNSLPSGSASTTQDSSP